MPHRFRSAAHWAELIRHGLQDAAIISSLALDKPLLSGKAPQWKGLTAMPLGQLSMQLIASTDCIRRALLPRKVAMPLLHQGVMSAGSLIEQQPAACQERAAWIKRAHDRKLAVPICMSLLAPGWPQSNGLAALPEQPALIEQLWLLLPQAAVDTKVVRQNLRLLRLQISKIENYAGCA